jgi:hypothetical protein
MTHAAEQNAATQAFDDLRAEVALMRRGVEALSAERASAPDYAPTLQTLVDRQDAIADALRKIYATPTMKMTPAEFGAEMSKATEHLRTADRQAIVEAGAEFQRAIGRLDGIVERGQANDAQRMERVLWGAGGIVIGILLWSALPGAVARALPASWHVPEWMASRTMDMDEKEAGQRLLMVAKQRTSNSGRVSIFPDCSDGGRPR